MAERIIDTSNMEIDYKCELIRCRDCKWLGRKSIIPGEYRCNRTERVTELDDYCSKAVRRDEHKGC